MLKLFKTQRINSNLILFILLVIIQSNSTFAHFQQNFFSIPLLGNESLISIFSAILLIFGVALLTTNICNRFRLTESYTNLSGLIVVFLSSTIPSLFAFHNWAVILILHLFIFNKLFKASLKNHPEPNFFDCAFLLGIVALFYPPLVLLYPALLFSFYIIQPAKLHYLSISLVSLLMPLLFLTVYLVWQKNIGILPIVMKAYRYELCHFSFEVFQKSSFVLLPFFIMILISIFFSLGRSHLFQVNQKNSLQTSTTYVITTIIVFFAFQITGHQVQTSLIIPASFLLTYFFFYQNEQLSNVLLLLLFVLSLVYPWVSV